MKKPQQKRRNKPGFELLPHTADIGLRCYGRTAEELFQQAAAGMFHIIGTRYPGRCIAASDMQEQHICVQAKTQEELLVAWLSELLSVSDAQDVMLQEVYFRCLGEQSLEARVRFAPKNSRFYRLRTEIKAVTYHKLCIHNVRDELQADVYFDV